MNDYLTQLVARNLGAADVVRPLPTPLFAPERDVEPPGEPELFLETPAGAAPTRPEPSVQSERRASFDTATQPDRLPPLPEAARLTSSPNVAPAPVPAARPAAGEPALEPLAARRGPPEIVVQAEVRPATSPLPPPAPATQPPARDAFAQIPPAPQRATIEPALTGQIQPPAIQPAPERREARRADQPPAPRMAQQPMPERAKTEPAAVAPAAPVEAHPVRAALEAAPVRLEVSPDPPPAPSTRPTIVPQPAVVVNAPARRATRPAAAQPPPAPEPTIHVTIGRIEVRAAPPPAPQARLRSAPAPAMNLDDYLRERGGGRR